MTYVQYIWDSGCACIRHLCKWGLCVTEAETARTLQSRRPAVCVSSVSWLQACGFWIMPARKTLTQRRPLTAASVNLVVKMVSIIWLDFICLGGWLQDKHTLWSFENQDKHHMKWEWHDNYLAEKRVKRQTLFFLFFEAFETCFLKPANCLLYTSCNIAAGVGRIFSVIIVGGSCMYKHQIIESGNNRCVSLLNKPLRLLVVPFSEWCHHLETSASIRTHWENNKRMIIVLLPMFWRIQIHTSASDTSWHTCLPTGLQVFLQQIKHILLL